MKTRLLFYLILGLSSLLFSQNNAYKSLRVAQKNGTVIGNDNHFFYVRNGDYIFKRDYKNNLLDSILFDNRYPNKSIKLVIQNDDPVIASRGGGMVWKVKNDTFKRADNSFDHKMSNHSTVFVRNDTIMKFGGYGYWSRRNFFTYYSEATKEWEFYSINPKSALPPEISNVNTIFSNDYFYFSGGDISDYKSPMNKTNNDNVWRFDFKNKFWTDLGIAKFSNTPNKKLLDIGNGRHLSKDNKFNGLIYNYKENKISQFKRLNPILEIGSGFVANDSLYNFRKNQLIGMSLNSYLNTNLNDMGAVYVDTKALFDKLTRFIVVTLITIFAIVLFLYSKNRKRPRLSETGFRFNRVHYQLSKNELMVLNLILYNKRVESKLILKKIYDPQLSVAQNNRNKTELIESLNQKVSNVMGIKNFINSKKSLKDQRLLIYYSNFRSDFVL